jgi:hypothetical protein
MLCRSKSLYLGLLISVLSLCAPMAFAQQSPKETISFETPLTSFDHYGQKIQLYKTNYVGAYVDQFGAEWLFVPNERGLKEATQRIAMDNFSDWKNLGDFKLYSDASPAEIQFSRKMDPSAIQGVFVDARGDKWALVPDATKSQGVVYIRLDRITTEQMITTFAGKFEIPTMVVESMKSYVPEQIKFTAVLFGINMAKCFGGGIAGLPFSNANSYSPTCVDDFIHHATDPKGMAGFYFFILFNRGATQGLNQIATILAANAKNPESALILRQKLMPLFGYLGMAAGSLASSVTSHFLNAPSWGQCFKLFTSEGMTSQPCKEAYTYFLSVEGFWGDFAGSTAEMLTAAILASSTQAALKYSANYIINSSLARSSVKFLGGSVRALEMTGKAGAGIVQAVRFVGTTSLVSGIPGVVVFVTTQVGSYILFLAWDEIIRAPFMREYNSNTKSWDIGTAIKTINTSMDETKKLSFEKAYLPETCKKVFKKAPRGSFTMKCTTSAPLDEGLKNLRLAATQYRKSVLMDGLEEATSSWKSKVTGYLSHYRASKMLLEYIHELKEQNLATVMDVQLAGKDYVSRWKAALQREVPDQSPFKQTMLRQFAQIDYYIYQVDEMNRIEDDSTWWGKARALFYDLQEKVKASRNPNYLNARGQLRRALVANKKYVDENIGRALEIPELFQTPPFVCDSAPHSCRVYMTYLKVNFEKLRIDVRSASMAENNAGVVQFLASSFGTKAVNDVLYDMLCGYETDFILEGTNDNGRAAAFHPPSLIKGAAREQFLRDNCTHPDGQPKFSFTQDDFSKTWIYKDHSYADPLDILIDAHTPLVTGFYTADAEEIWKEKAFRPTMKFMAQATFDYNSLLQKNYAPLIPEDTPESLIRRSSPQMRGASLDYKIGSYIAFNPWARPTLSESLMGQTLFMLNHIKYSMGGDSQTYALADKLALSMAKLILTFRKIPAPALAKEKMLALQNDLVKLELVDNSLQVTLNEFEDTMTQMVLSEAVMNEIIANMAEVHQISSDLYKHLTGTAFDDMMDEKERYKAGLTPEEQGKLTMPEYKKYIYFKLIWDNTNDIVINYLSLDLYQKLSLKPLLEIKNEELL